MDNSDLRLSHSLERLESGRGCQHHVSRDRSTRTSSRGKIPILASSGAAAELCGLAQSFSLGISGILGYQGSHPRAVIPQLSRAVNPCAREGCDSQGSRRSQEWEQGWKSLQDPSSWERLGSKQSQPGADPLPRLEKDKSMIFPDPHRALSHLASTEKPQTR